MLVPSAPWTKVYGHTVWNASRITFILTALYKIKLFQEKVQMKEVSFWSLSALWLTSIALETSIYSYKVQRKAIQSPNEYYILPTSVTILKI